MIARPSPLPPYLRVVEESACENRRKYTSGSVSGDSDPGVFHRKMKPAPSGRSIGVLLDRYQSTPPLIGELDRVADEVDQDLPQPQWIAHQVTRNLGRDRTVLSLFSCARTPKVSTHRSTTS